MGENALTCDSKKETRDKNQSLSRSISGKQDGFPESCLSVLASNRLNMASQFNGQNRSFLNFRYKFDSCRGYKKSLILTVFGVFLFWGTVCRDLTMISVFFIVLKNVFFYGLRKFSFNLVSQMGIQGFDRVTKFNYPFLLCRKTTDLIVIIGYCQKDGLW